MWIQTGVTVRKRSSWVVTSVTLTFDLWPWPFAWTLTWSLVITPENFMMIRWWEHSQKGVTDGQTDGQTDRRTENTIHRAAWSQLKMSFCQISKLLEISSPSLVVCKILTQGSSLETFVQFYHTQFELLKFLCFCEYSLLQKLSTKNTENQQQKYIQSAYWWGMLMLGGLFLVIKKYDLIIFFIINFHRFQVQFTISNFSSKKDTIFITNVKKI